MKSGVTRMAEALTKAMQTRTARGQDSGRVGHRILTNNAKMGRNGTPAKRKADSAAGS